MLNKLSLKLDLFKVVLINLPISFLVIAVFELQYHLTVTYPIRDRFFLTELPVILLCTGKICFVGADYEVQPRRLNLFQPKSSATINNQFVFCILNTYSLNASYKNNLADDRRLYNEIL